MKRGRLLESEPCENPGGEQDEVMAVSQLVEVDGVIALNIDLFYMGELKGRYFADEETHNSWVNGKWYRCKLTNTARLCKGESPVNTGIYYIGEEYEWSSKDDKERAMDFLDTWSIGAYEEKINNKKRETAIKRKVKRIEDMMSEIPCVPDEAERWVKDKLFAEDILFTKKGEKRTAYSCTACGCHGWKKDGWKHGEKTVCPKCGQPVTVNSKQLERTKNKPVVILQVYGQQWIERQFVAVCNWKENQKKEVRLFEQCRAIIPKGKCWGNVWYGLIHQADEFMQEFWDKNPENKRFVKSYLWPGNLNEVLPYGELEKSGLDILAMRGEKINVNKFITSFHKRPWIEYLTKAGMSRLVEEIVDVYGCWGNPSEICTTGKNLREALMLDGNRVYRMKQINGGITALSWLQYEEANGIKISQESLEYLSNKDVPVEKCEDILKELKSVNRMVNYMRKQKMSPRKLVGTWKDYLRMAETEGLDTTDDIVRLPKDLKARHDQLVEIRNARLDAERIEKEKKKYDGLNKKIEEHLPMAERYCYEDDEYLIIPARKCEQLIEEGRKLHHCVGASDTYMNKMSDGTSWILFLRKKIEPQQAYYTIEVGTKDDRIIQWYSEYDRKPDKEKISKVLERFRASVKRKRNQARVRVPVLGIA